MQTEHLEARASASLLLHPRVGIVVPKYKQNIVARNRVRRRLRELVRLRLLPQTEKVDVLLRARPTAYDSSFDQLATEIDEITSWVLALASQ